MIKIIKNIAIILLCFVFMSCVVIEENTQYKNYSSSERNDSVLHQEDYWLIGGVLIFITTIFYFCIKYDKQKRKNDNKNLDNLEKYKSFKLEKV